MKTAKIALLGAASMLAAFGLVQAKAAAPAPAPSLRAPAPVPAAQRAAVPSAAPAPATLRVGAAKVEFTPLVSELRTPTDIIRDPLFARAFVISGPGNTCAVLVGLDYGGAREPVIASALPRVAAATGCAEQNILISATHTHSSNTLGLGGAGNPTPEKVANAIVAAVTQAKARQRPARIGYGTAQIALNANRDLYTEDMEWRQQTNPDGRSDKTLAVVEFIGEDYIPIGVYMNYAMHPVNFYNTGVISADFPGVASRTIEEAFDEKTVAIFAQGASGDQNPLYRAGGNVTSLRTGGSYSTPTIGAPPRPQSPAQPASINPVADATDAQDRPIPPDKLADYRKQIARIGAAVDAQGQIVALATMNLMRSEIKTTGADAIWGGQRRFTCPGRERLDAANPARENVFPGYGDGADVNLKVGVLRIGDVNFVSVNGEVYSEIATRLKAASPAAHTIVSTLSNGAANSGYIYPDDEYYHLSFQVIGSRLKPGCAEKGIINSALDLIDQAYRK